MISVQKFWLLLNIAKVYTRALIATPDLIDCSVQRVKRQNSMAFLEEIMEDNESDLRDELKVVDKGGGKGGGKVDDKGGAKDYLWCDGKDDYKDDNRDDVKDDDEVSSVALVDEGSRCKMAVRVQDSQRRRRPGGDLAFTMWPHIPTAVHYLSHTS